MIAVTVYLCPFYVTPPKGVCGSLWRPCLGLGLRALARLFPYRVAVGPVCSLAQRIEQLSGLWPGILGKGKQRPTRALLTAPSGLFLDNHGWIFSTPRQPPPLLGLQVWGRDSYAGGS